MRKTSEILDQLRARNILVFLENGKVKVDADKDALSSEIFQELKAAKEDIKEHLEEIELIDRLQIHQVLNRLMKKGCNFELAEDTAFYDENVLTDVEKGWLISNYREVLANLFQYWLVKNVFNQKPGLLEEFQFETVERISILEDSNIESAYLDGVLMTARKWFTTFQNEEIEII